MSPIEQYKADAQADYDRMCFCVREASRGWSPLGVREFGVQEAYEIECYAYDMEPIK